MSWKDEEERENSVSGKGNSMCKGPVIGQKLPLWASGGQFWVWISCRMKMDRSRDQFTWGLCGQISSADVILAVRRHGGSLLGRGTPFPHLGLCVEADTPLQRLSSQEGSSLDQMRTEWVIQEASWTQQRQRLMTSCWTRGRPGGQDVV